MSRPSSPKGRKLDFALAFISALRHDHGIHWPMTQAEISDMTKLVAHEMGWSSAGCTRQNIDRIEQIAKRRAGLKLTEQGINPNILFGR